MTALAWFALAVFIAAFVFISLGKIDITVIALLGASIFVATGVLPPDKIFSQIDWNVVFLLVSMMVVINVTKTTGLFQFIAIKTAKIVRGNPLTLLILLSCITAVISCFLDNVTTVLILIPVTIVISEQLEISPIPFTISLALASNIGGTATLIGDPPNVMIGSAAGLDFLSFIENLGPVIIVVLAAFCVIVGAIFRKQLKVTNEKRALIMDFDEAKALTDKPLLIKCGVVLGLIILGFFLHGLIHIEASMVAMIGASILLLLTKKNPVDEFFRDVEWSTIIFFIGLFILVGGVVQQGWIDLCGKWIISVTHGNIELTAIIILWVSGIVSAIVNNIPFIATLIPLVLNIGLTGGLTKPELAPLWWALSLGACLGGNGTLVGASANVVSAGISGKNGYPVSFAQFTKYGAPITVVGLVICTGYLLVRYF